jgi:aspartokinase
MSVDPKTISNARKLAEIDIETLMQLADSGKKFIHRKALRYKDPSTNVRVIDLKYADLSREGTLITGAISAESGVAVTGPLRAASITVVGQRLSDEPTIIQELTEKLKTHSALLGLSADRTSIILYALKNGGLDPLLNEIHEVILNHKQALAMTVRTDLAYIEASGIVQEEVPTIIGRISEALRLNEMNMFSFFTIASSITIFASWNDRENVLNVVKESLRR